MSVLFEQSIDWGGTEWQPIERTWCANRLDMAKPQQQQLVGKSSERAWSVCGSLVATFAKQQAQLVVS